MTFTYTAKRTRHKYAERFKLTSECGARGEVEKCGDNDWRIRFGSLIGSTKHASMDDAAAVVFNAYKEAVARLVVV